MPKLATPAMADAGLTTQAAAERLKADGYNDLPVADRRSFLRILWEVLRQPMFALLIAGGAVYLLLGDRTEALLLLVFASLSVSITIVQESRSERVLEALRDLASPRALVIRDGQHIQIAGREVVVGDLLVVGEGERVPADASLIRSLDLLVDESLLTGESVPVRKTVPVGVSPKSDLTPLPRPGGEDLPYLFSGTLIVRGSGIARVHATGSRSEMGKIGRALGSIETEQPHLQRQMRWLVRDYAIGGAIAGALIVLLFGLLRGSWLQAMLGGIAIGMSLLPEEFPLVMAVFMAMGAWRISRVRVLTRRAAAIETLGATTVLCTDKTGTLTENRMTVAALVSADAQWQVADARPLPAALIEPLQAALGACPLEPTDPMDRAVHALAGTQPAVGIATFKTRIPVRSYGLRPDLFAVTNVSADAIDGAAIAYAKGAIEAIGELCRLTPDQLAAIRAQADRLASDGVRVLGIAQAKLSDDIRRDLPETPRGLPFAYLGLIGFADPLRKDVPAAVAQCRSAGIRVVMITGDYPVTAGAIGRQAGIEAATVISGHDIDAMSDEVLTAQVQATSIFARIRPNQKLRIVQSLKARGEVVAMTGDGVNDAPAIKAAHIGIAMGGRGTDVAREAAAIVLLDDDFGSIVTTIRLGRRIYDNLRKAIEYIVAVHIPIAGLALLPLLLGLPLILTPIHIAFLEMVIDPACSVVFEAEVEEDDVMRRPPRDPGSPLLLPRRIVWALLQGLLVLVALGGLLVGAARTGLGETDLRALMFASLVLTNLGLILVNRSFTASLVRAFLRPNRSLWLLVTAVTAVLAVAVYWPPAQTLFHFGRLHGDDLAVCAALGTICVLVLEALKSRWFRSPVPARYSV
jgi:Ca2+-transporting ATPase